MSRTALGVDDLTPTRRSDPVFGVAAGLYLTLLLSPLVLAFISVAGVDGPAVLYGAFLATGVVTLALAGWVFSRRPGLVPRLGASRLTWSPALMGLAVATASFALLEVGGVAAGAGFFLGLLAMSFGLLLGALARSRTATAVLEGEPEGVVFEAGWPAGARRRVYAVASVLAALSVVAFVAGVVAGSDWLTTIGQFWFTLGIVAPTYAQSRTYRVTPAGLAIQNPLVTRLLPWSAFEGYARTDDAIVLHRRWRVDVRVAVADLGDAAAVEDAVSAHLARRA